MSGNRSLHSPVTSQPKLSNMSVLQRLQLTVKGGGGGGGYQYMPQLGFSIYARLV